MRLPSESLLGHGLHYECHARADEVHIYGYNEQVSVLKTKNRRISLFNSLFAGLEALSIYVTFMFTLERSEKRVL